MTTVKVISISHNVKYVISHSDVINAVSHIKNGKSDGSEGLFSDHFLLLLSAPPLHHFSVSTHTGRWYPPI